MSASRLKGRVWKFAEFEFWEVSRQLMTRGEVLRVEGKPREVLACLLEAPQRVVSTEYLLDTVWPDVATGPDSVTQAVAKLRRIFGGGINRIILTVSKEGYRMALPVLCTFQEEAVGSLHLHPGDEMPRRPSWRAVRDLTREEALPVWLARHSKTSEELEFKFALDGIRLRVLQREFAISRLLTKSLGARADFVVPFVDASFEELPSFIASPPSGVALQEWSCEDRFRALTLDERVEIVARIATSMAFAHQLAIFHNDLKPANLLVVDDGLKLRVADFGRASLAEPALLQELEVTDPDWILGSGDDGRPLGSAMYRAPEIRLNETPTALNDVYAMGVLLFQVVCGNFDEPPLPGWEEKIPDQLLRRDIEQAAQLDPGKRIQTMAQLATRLTDYDARRREETEQEEARFALLAMEDSMLRLRMRRPWVRLTVVSLLLGLTASVWTANRALHERDMERSANAKLESMYEFLAKDVLGQSSPYLRTRGQRDATKQTLVEAVATAAPRIDSRFAQQEGIAGRLHETIADTYKDRTRFTEANHEYVAAAKDFRAAEGDLSQAAFIADLKREFSDLTSMRPGSMTTVATEFHEERTRLDQVKRPSAVLQAWETLVETTLLGLGPQPEQTLPLIDAAVRHAQATPEFDPALLLRLKKQRCGTYVRLGDGVNLERVSREMIADVSATEGGSGAQLFPFQMYLEEAFYLQGKYPETVAQADANFGRFEPVLGDEDQMTIATRATRAAAEAQMGRYKEAVSDALALHVAAEQSGDVRLAVGSLNDAATFACHSGDLTKGMQYAREVEREAGPGPMAQPMFLSGARFTLAECMLSALERNGRRADARALEETSDLLAKVDVRAMSETSDATEYQGAWDVAMARLARLKGLDLDASRYTDQAHRLLDIPHADPFERRELGRLESSLSRH